ncbi:MAG: hypothetical protein HWN68_02165 [Desulfobacterales bacterium]|nr:hypothetical protein [Desulfobacterales bacterium]
MAEHCPIYPNHNIRKDGTCARQAWCIPYQVRRDPRCLIIAARVSRSPKKTPVQQGVAAKTKKEDEELGKKKSAQAETSPETPVEETPVAEKEKKVTKQQRVYERYQEEIAKGTKPKEAYDLVGPEFGISPRAVRSYVWRAEHPEEFKAMLKKYAAARKAKKAAE